MLEKDMTVGHDKHERLVKVNRLIKAIPAFQCDEGYSYLSMIHNRVYFVDCSEETLPLSHTNTERWNECFSQGNKYKLFIIALYSYVRRGKRILWDENYGKNWGCSEDELKRIKNKAVDELRIFKTGLL